jgi:3-oxoacyl-[acyl-carrier-protein] synthase II
MKKRIVVTGLGAVTPAGNDVDSFWASLVEARSGITVMKAETTDDLLPTYVANVKEFDPGRIGLPLRKLKMMGRPAQLMLGAAAEASRMAGLSDNTNEKLLERCGIVVGVGMLNADISEFVRTIQSAQNSLPHPSDPIDVEYFSRAAATEMFPLWLLRHIPNMVAAHTGIMLKIRGVSNTVMNGCSSAAFAIGESMRVIERGEADVMLAAGVDSRVNSMSVLRYLKLGWQVEGTADDPATVSKPFDQNAAGFVSGEAAGVLVLEEYRHALDRGATILAEITGCGAGNDAFDVFHPHPEGRGLSRAISRCLRKSNSDIQIPDAVFASANGIPEYDCAAARALKDSFNAFGITASVTATRSLVGHSHAASFALDAIAAVKALNHNIIPPTINLKDPIDDFDFVINNARATPVRTAMVTGYGIGGHAGALTLRRCEQ